MDFEAIKPRIFNAVAVGEMHHITAPSRLITKSRSHWAAKSAEKFAKNKDCFVQMQSLFVFYESLLRARAITYFGYAEILAPTSKHSYENQPNPSLFRLLDPKHARVARKGSGKPLREVDAAACRHGDILAAVSGKRCAAVNAQCAANIGGNGRLALQGQLPGRELVALGKRAQSAARDCLDLARLTAG